MVEKVCSLGHTYKPGRGCPRCIQMRATKWRREKRQADPEFRARTYGHSQASTRKRRASDAEFVAKEKAYQAEYHRKRSADPDYVERRRNNTRRLREDPEYAATQRARAIPRDRQRNADPDFVARKLQYMKERFQRPEVRDMHRTNNHRRRARVAGSGGAGVTPAQWRSICAQERSPDGYTLCFYCRTPCKPTLDHFIPLARGGRDDASNAVPACRKCNCGKRDRLLHEWHRAEELLGTERYAALVQRCASEEPHPIEALR